MFDMQALIDGMGAKWQEERSQTQMTLGELIERLEALPEGVTVNIDEPHSYRGYYCDLAFEPSGPVSAHELAKTCREEIMGRALTGYKGGDFVMGEKTPVWVSQYGTTGERLMAIEDDGAIKTEPQEDDD